jgi:hypothetical protein
MNELVNLVMQKTGLSQENAQKAVQTVIDFLKTKLPAPLAGQVDNVLTGDYSGVAGQAGEVLKGLGEKFGGQKQ